MILAVDVGNSNTTVGLFDEAGKLTLRALLETSRGKTRDQCAIDLLGVLNLYGAQARAVDGAILSSVVPPLTAVFIDAIARLTGKPPLVVGPGIKTGLNIKAEIHNQLGSDIVASSVAAIDRYPSPLVMVDMGTATSLSLIVGSVYEGCSIMPGLGGHALRRALWTRQHGGRHGRPDGGGAGAGGHGGCHRRQRPPHPALLQAEDPLRRRPGHDRALSALSEKRKKAPEGVTLRPISLYSTAARRE